MRAGICRQYYPKQVLGTLTLTDSEMKDFHFAINYFNANVLNGVVKLAHLGLSGITVKAGAYLPVPEGSAITDITMASGDCLIYNQ